MATPSQKLVETKNDPGGGPQLCSHTLCLCRLLLSQITALRTSWLNTWTLDIAPQPHLHRLTVCFAVLSKAIVAVVHDPSALHPLLPFSILPLILLTPARTTRARLFLSFALAFSWTVLYDIFFGPSKVRHLLPPSSYAAIPSSAPCLPALIRHNLLYW